MYECPNCGGELRFDIASQKLICAHCKKTTEYTDLKEESAAKEAEIPEENEASGARTAAAGS